MGTTVPTADREPTAISLALTWPDGSVTEFALSPPDPEIEGERWDARWSVDRDLADQPASRLAPPTVQETRVRFEVEAVYRPTDRDGQPRTCYTVTNRPAPADEATAP